MRYVLPLLMLAGALASIVPHPPVPTETATGSEAQWIRVYPNAFSPELCRQFMELIDTADPKLVGHPNVGYRKSLQMSFPRHELPTSQGLFDQMTVVLKHYFDVYQREVPHRSNLFHITRMELPTVLKYMANGEDKFIIHADAWNGASAGRVLSVIIYLNDVTEGGVTTFHNQHLSIIPKAGSIAIFPSFLTYPHEATTPVSNDKYNIVTWLGFKDDGGFYGSVPF